jgi:hypothetical protein
MLRGREFHNFLIYRIIRDNVYYVRFDWVERHKVLHYTVKDTHGTVAGYGAIPARASPCSAFWATSDHSSADASWQGESR